MPRVRRPPRSMRYSPCSTVSSSLAPRRPASKREESRPVGGEADAEVRLRWTFRGNGRSGCPPREGYSARGSDDGRESVEQRLRVLRPLRGARGWHHARRDRWRDRWRRAVGDEPRGRDVHPSRRPRQPSRSGHALATRRVRTARRDAASPAGASGHQGSGYRLQITPTTFLKPDLQMIWNPVDDAGAARERRSSASVGGHLVSRVGSWSGMPPRRTRGSAAHQPLRQWPRGQAAPPERPLVVVSLRLTARRRGR